MIESDNTALVPYFPHKRFVALPVRTEFAKLTQELQSRSILLADVLGSKSWIKYIPLNALVCVDMLPEASQQVWHRTPQNNDMQFQQANLPKITFSLNCPFIDLQLWRKDQGKTCPAPGQMWLEDIPSIIINPIEEKDWERVRKKHIPNLTLKQHDIIVKINLVIDWG